MASVPDRLAYLQRVRWRPMAEADLAYVAALENEIHAAPWSVGNFRDALAAGYGATVAERDGRILAFGVMTRAAPQLNVFSLGFPVSMVFGLFIVWASMREFMPRFDTVSAQAFALMRQLAGVP